MKGLTRSSAAVALVAIIAGACTADIPSAAAPTDPALAKGGPSAAAAYTVLDVGALLPGTSSQAQGVNDAGDVAGFYYSGSAYYPFAFVSGAAVTLGGGPGMAWGMSSTYVGGNSNGLPARWSLADPTQRALLPLTAAEVEGGWGGQLQGVNDAGDVVGSVGPNAAMWLADGTRIPIATQAGYGRGEGRGIDNGGLAVFQFTVAGGNSETAVGRAYLRLASGAMIELLPDGSDVTSYANDISEVANGVVYVAGSTRSSALVSRSVRWTVDVTTEAVTADVLATVGAHGLGVSDAGGVAVFIMNDRSLREEAFLWRGTNVLKLAPPKGTNNPEAWALSPSGRYVAGFARSGSRALRWTIVTP
jgi:hypothetical protein